MKIIILIFAICAFPAFSYCQDNTLYKIDTILETCLKENVSTPGIKECFGNAQVLWDKELNKYYQLLLSKLDSTGQATLKLSQRQWIIFRDNEIKFLLETYGRKDGQMWDIMIAERAHQLIRQRAVDLMNYYETFDVNGF